MYTHQQTWKYDKCTKMQTSFNLLLFLISENTHDMCAYNMWINGQLNEIQLALSNHGTTRVSIFLPLATIPVPQQHHAIVAGFLAQKTATRTPYLTLQAFTQWYIQHQWFRITLNEFHKIFFLMNLITISSPLIAAFSLPCRLSFIPISTNSLKSVNVQMENGYYAC